VLLHCGLLCISFFVPVQPANIVHSALVVGAHASCCKALDTRLLSNFLSEIYQLYHGSSVFA